MTEREYVPRRMDRSLDQAIDIAEEKARDRGVSLPPEIIGQMALQMFSAKMAIAMRNPSAYDLPEDVGRESY